MSKEPTKPSKNGSHLQTCEEKKFAEIIAKAEAYDQIISANSNKAMEALESIGREDIDEIIWQGNHDFKKISETKRFENIKNRLIKTADYDEIKKEHAELKEKNIVKFDDIKIGDIVEFTDGSISIVSDKTLPNNIFDDMDDGHKPNEIVKHYKRDYIEFICKYLQRSE